MNISEIYLHFINFLWKVKSIHICFCTFGQVCVIKSSFICNNWTFSDQNCPSDYILSITCRGITCIRWFRTIPVTFTLVYKLYLELSEAYWLGKWGHWSMCSVTCGNGTQWSSRQCKPEHKDECSRIKPNRTRVCPTQLCPGNTHVTCIWKYSK